MKIIAAAVGVRVRLASSARGGRYGPLRRFRCGAGLHQELLLVSES